MTVSKKKKWTKKELTEFKKIIIIKQKTVIADLAASRERADEALNANSVNAIYSSHMADAGSDQQEMEKNYYMMDRGNNFLKYQNRALEMLQEGTFGKCTNCGNLIDKERLNEVPHTSSCFDCKSNSA